MKRVLITGGAGFIGTHLTRELLAKDYQVISIDNFFTGHKQNVLPFLDNPNYESIRHDIVNPLLLEVDEIYHLACPASPIHYQHNSIKTVKTNVLGTINMLGLAKRVKAKFLMASTSEVYGDPQVHPQTENYWGNVNPIGLRSCYDEGKRIAETLTMEYFRCHHLDIRIIRIFNTYGPYMSPDDGRVVSNFIIQALKGDDITLYGDGSQTRSFCYVDDLVYGMIKMMENNFIGPINLGNPWEFSVKELAKKVLKLIPSNSQLVYQPLPSDDPKRRKPNIDLAKKKLDWEPKISLQEGLKRTIPWFKETLRKNGNA